MQNRDVLRAHQTITTPPDPSTALAHIADETAYGEVALSRQKMVQAPELPGQPIERDQAGVWHIRRYDEARALLRRGDTKQAGFAAEQIERMPPVMRLPILYQEGKTHQQQRKQIARFFTPKAVNSNYRGVMEAMSDQLIDGLRKAKQGDLSAMSLTLASQVVATVLGLQQSRLPGVNQRLVGFVKEERNTTALSAQKTIQGLRGLVRSLVFYLLDVQPAIRARRHVPREDLISHLLAQGYRDSEVLTECLTFGVAGVVTTREFICVAAWHMIERPELRERFLAGVEEERHHLLHEILRLEPVVQHIYRRTVDEVQLESQGASVVIPPGELIDVHVAPVDADESVVGVEPLAVCPGRTLAVAGISPSVMGFGDGHHRCAGEFVAIQEADIFLQRLLALRGLRITQEPEVSWNVVSTGYELRAFRVAIA
jgi:cytochrome P450